MNLKLGGFSVVLALDNMSEVTSGPSRSNNFGTLPNLKMHHKGTTPKLQNVTLSKDGNFRIGVPTIGIVDKSIDSIWWGECYAPLHEYCTKYHSHNGDPKATPATCGVIGEKTQVMLMWVSVKGVGHPSHQWIVRFTRVRP